MNIAVIGSRTFNNQTLMNEELSSFFERDDRLISGGARGADQMAETWCRKQGIECYIIRPDWKTHGRSAAFKRNHQIIGEAEMVIAFWDGKSKGTKHSIDLAKAKRIQVEICQF